MGNWIDDNKGEGPWALIEQPDKNQYNEGDEISSSDNPVFNIDFTGNPITERHKPCGYWFKDLPPVVVQAPIFYGDIICTIIDTLVFDTTFYVDGNLVHVDEDIYAVLYRQNSGVMYLRTFTIDADGAYGAVIDSWLIDAGPANNGGILNVSDTVYVILKSVGWNDALIATVSIANNGTITKSFIDSTAMPSRSIASRESLINVSGGVYAMVFEGWSGSGRIETVTVSDGGQISVVLDSHLYETTTDSAVPTIKKINSNGAFGVAYVTGGTPRVLRFKTFAAPAGTIGEIASLDLGDVLTYYYYVYPKILSDLLDFDGVLVFSGDHQSGGRVRSVSVNANGMGLAKLDDQEIDTYVIHPEPLNTFSNGALIAYSGPPSIAPKLHIQSLTVSPLGIIDFIADCELTASGSQNAALIKVENGNGLYQVAYAGAGSDGTAISFIVR